MKTNKKVWVQITAISSLIVLAAAQSSYRNQRKRQPKDEPVEQGRTLGLLRPLVGLGLSSLARPLVGFDAPVVQAAPYRPSSATASSQSDPYGYGNYGGYVPNFYNGYNYYGGYPLYRPFYRPFYYGYRPQAYPANYGGYPQYNGFGGQRPVYSSSRPQSIGQRPISGQQPVAYPSTTSTGTTSGTATPGATSPQAAQIANLLGQLLGQQLRPLLNQGAASPAHDEPGIAPSNYESKTYKDRYYRG